MQLAGTKAVVFGGTSGIGLATVEQLAARGAQVVAISRHPERATLPDGVETRSCDVLDEAAVAAVLEECGPYDSLVSAATGGERAMGPFLEMDPAGFRKSFDKVWGYANVVRFGAKHLRESGSIVLVSGTPARRIKPGLVALGAAGAAVESLARSVAPELVPRRINVVAPGTIDTPINPLEGDARAEAFRRATASHLIPRAGTADEVAAAILFCLENDFVTGTTVDVDGGWLLA
ncbi:MAG: SDR family oxidoreductase [Acidimicrobiales bacterium]